MSEFRDAVAAAADGTPYTVIDTDDGFIVELRLADAKWWGLFNRAGLTETFRWRVAEHGTRFTIADLHGRVEWVVGAPRMKGEWETFTGREISFSRQKIWALSDNGRIEPVVDYRFDSEEGRELIRMVAERLGLRETWPVSMKIGLAAALLPAVGFTIGGPLLPLFGQPLWFGLLFAAIGVVLCGFLWLLTRLV